MPVLSLADTIRHFEQKNITVDPGLKSDLENDDLRKLIIGVGEQGFISPEEFSRLCQYQISFLKLPEACDLITRSSQTNEGIPCDKFLKLNDFQSSALCNSEIRDLIIAPNHPGIVSFDEYLQLLIPQQNSLADICFVRCLADYPEIQNLITRPGHQGFITIGELLLLNQPHTDALLANLAIGELITRKNHQGIITLDEFEQLSFWQRLVLLEPNSRAFIMELCPPGVRAVTLLQQLDEVHCGTLLNSDVQNFITRPNHLGTITFDTFLKLDKDHCIGLRAPDVRNLISSSNNAGAMTFAEFQQLSPDNYYILSSAGVINAIRTFVPQGTTVFNALLQLDLNHIRALQNINVQNVIMQLSRAGAMTFDAYRQLTENQLAMLTKPVICELILAGTLPFNTLQQLNDTGHFIIIFDYDTQIINLLRTGIINFADREQFIALANEDNAEHLLQTIHTNPQILADLIARRITILDVIRQLPRPAAAAINRPQSTHTASVHRSVSDSATRLLARYGRQLSNVESVSNKIDDLEACVFSLTEEAKQQAALRCIDRIRTIDFTDPASRVTLKKLLALAFTAIQDDSLREGGYENALERLIVALYEIQRGYNLSDAPGEEYQDNGMRDNSICVPGSFNKLIEKLNSIHPDCEIIVESLPLLNLKLPVVVKEELRAYLSQLAISLQTAQEASTFTNLIQRIISEGISDYIYEKIRANITNKILMEFPGLFPNIIAAEKGTVIVTTDSLRRVQEERNVFAQLISAGKDATITAEDVVGARKQLVESIGYREWCSCVMRQSMFAVSPVVPQCENQDDEQTAAVSLPLKLV